MIEVLGWLTLAFGGAYAIAQLGFVLTLMVIWRGGIESFMPAVYAGVACALCWISFIYWLAPISITVGG